MSKELPPEYGALKDERGIASLDFELTGSLSKPIPRPKFKKPVERLIEREKVKVKEEVKKEVEKKKEELKEEAEKKLRELFK